MAVLLKFLLILVMVLPLMSCGRSSKQPPKLTAYSRNLLNNARTQHLMTTQGAQNTLTEAAIAISKSLRHLAEIEHAVNQPAVEEEEKRLDSLEFKPSQIGMAQITSVDWTGPIEPLLRKIADASNYTISVLGKAPAIPILVSVTAKNTPLANILRDVRFQAQKQATITLHPKRHLIELRYSGA